jgi:hypothetical protein
VRIQSILARIRALAQHQRNATLPAGVREDADGYETAYRLALEDPVATDGTGDEVD